MKYFWNLKMADLVLQIWWAQTLFLWKFLILSRFLNLKTPSEVSRLRHERAFFITLGTIDKLACLFISNLEEFDIQFELKLFLLIKHLLKTLHHFQSQIEYHEISSTMFLKKYWLKKFPHELENLDFLRGFFVMKHSSCHNPDFINLQE